MSENMTQEVHGIIKKYLDGGYDGDPWKYKEPTNSSFLGGVCGLGPKIECVKFYIENNDDTVVCYHILPFNAPEEVRPAVSEFITRANYGLPFGNFEMDLTDGELRYKITIPHSAFLHSDESAFHWLKVMMKLGPSCWCKYSDGLAALLFGFAGERSVKELVEQCEA